MCVCVCVCNRIFHMPSCISIYIYKFLNYCIFYIVHYLTPPQLRQSVPLRCRLAHPLGMLALPIKYIKMVSKHSFSSTQGAGQAKHQNHSCGIYNTDHNQFILRATVCHSQFIGPTFPGTIIVKTSPRDWASSMGQAN